MTYIRKKDELKKIFVLLIIWQEYRISLFLIFYFDDFTKSIIKVLKKAVLLLLFIGFLVILMFVLFKHLHSIDNRYSTEFKNQPTEYVAIGGECVSCHSDVIGMGEVHSQIGCATCHFGNSQSSIKEEAHKGMVLIPGNASNMEKACGTCHNEAVKNIQSSMMSTNNGIVAVDKYIFGEVASPDGFEEMTELGHSVADEHLRNLCSHCHLGYEKEHTGAVDELSRGGGCTACHLNYSAKGKEAHLAYLNDRTILPTIHPSLDLAISNDHCFGCHSRSGRISTNYEGYHETLLNKNDMANVDGYRTLQDDRVFKFVSEDVHHTKGLLCIDCHTYADVMGDGKQYAHEEDAVKISCDDCHGQNLNTIGVEKLDPINKRIYKSRKYTHTQMLATSNEQVPLLNTYINELGKAKLISKKDGTEHLLTIMSSSCAREFGHQDLTCSSCHTAWAPQCIGCHVDYDSKAKGYDLLTREYKQGSWIEYAGEFLVGPPTLAISEKNGEREVQSAIPGMIFTLDQSGYDGKSASDTTFHRLFAPASPHTTSAVGRDCKSCHNNPVALGYGRGKLEFVTTGTQPHWKFEPEYANLPQDGLAADAWVGFLKESGPKSSTRLTFRAFSVLEQQKILTVGACLTCHDQGSELMQQSIHQDFEKLLSRLTDKCRTPQY